jgi:hypothetical protein
MDLLVPSPAMLERNQSRCSLISFTKVAASCWSRRLEIFGFRDTATLVFL